MVGSSQVLARAECAAGEVVLRRRGEILELMVNGAFAMDTTDVSTEVLLATEGLQQHSRPKWVLVGGLGLGFTTRALLADPRVGHVDVVELAEPLVHWSRSGLVRELSGIEGERCTMHSGDIARVLGGEGPAGPWDLILLDVDNGPDFLVHAPNARLYAADQLELTASRLSEGGLLGIWSSHLAPSLLANLRSIDPDVRESRHTVDRDGRTLEYAIYWARKPARVRDLVAGSAWR